MMLTTTRTTVIRLAEELGSVLSGRFEAEELRARIEAELAAGAEVVVSFQGVVAMSPSFADELFAKVSEEAFERGRVRFVDLAEDLLAIARFVREGRGRPA
ncbi:MAG TPA: STAS-like domain-containing protein [Gaiellaceae bacterium]|nr:STAS-like domain-containing protein [Gaiellaceae bacterium]